MTAGIVERLHAVAHDDNFVGEVVFLERAQGEFDIVLVIFSQ